MTTLPKFVRRFIPGRVIDRVVSCHADGETFALTSRIGLVTAFDSAVAVGSDHEFPGSVGRVFVPLDDYGNEPEDDEDDGVEHIHDLPAGGIAVGEDRQPIDDDLFSSDADRLTYENNVEAELRSFDLI